MGGYGNNVYGSGAPSGRRSGGPRTPSPAPHHPPAPHHTHQPPPAKWHIPQHGLANGEDERPHITLSHSEIELK